MIEPSFEIMHLENPDNVYPYSCHVELVTDRNFVIAPHYHYEVELLFFYSGQAQITIGNNSYIINKGEMVLINAMEVHSIRALQDTNMHYSVIMFNPSVIPSSSGTLFESRYITPFTMKDSALKRIYWENELKNSAIQNLFNNILDEYKKKQYGFEFAVRLGILQIILWILRNCNIASNKHEYEMPTLTKEQALRFEKLFEYIENSFSEEITAQQIMGICHINYSYFARQFKLVTGKTFKEYLNYIRISKAEKLILTTTLTITQIALSVGYTDTSYFIKQFRKAKNISPMQIRRILKSEAQG